MKPFKLTLFLALFLSFFLAGEKPATAQLSLSPVDTTVCPGVTYDITAGLASTFGGSGGITVDDKFGGVVNIGFNFVFYGQTYSQCVISANNFITFDLSLKNSYSNYTYNGASTSNQLSKVIMFPFQDVNMGVGGTISYQTVGVAPNRKFIVQFCECPLFSCNSLLVTNQLILYEGSNVIEMHITYNPSCLGWMGGTAIEGLRYNNLQDLVPGRDIPNSPWTATNDGRRFTPNGTNAYTIDTMPYNPFPIITNGDTADITWYAEGSLIPIGTGGRVTITANRSVRYYVAIYQGLGGCGGTTQLTYSDTSWVHLGTRYDTVRATICEGESYSFLGKEYYETGQYDTMFATSGSCDSFVTFYLTVNPLPDVEIKGPDDVTFCKGDSATISLLNPESTTSYQWFKDKAPMPGETQSSIVTEEPGIYFLKAVTDKGCQAISNQVKVTVYDNPIVNIQALPQSVYCSYDTIKLTVEKPKVGDMYIWKPGKPFRAVFGNNGPTVKGVFIHSTEVSVTTYNRFGCHGSDSIYVPTKPCCQVFMPNAFTPNGDGINDYVKPHLQAGQILVMMKIYNRNGQLVYNNETPKKGWDGTLKEQPAANATYMYMIQYTCADGKLYSRRGSINIVR